MIVMETNHSLEGIDRLGSHSDHKESWWQAHRLLPGRGYVSPKYSNIVLTLPLGFILDKTIAVNSPKRMENAKILIANTCMPHGATII